MKTDSSTVQSFQMALSSSTKRKKSGAVGSCQPDSDVTAWLEALSIQAVEEAPGPEWKTLRQIEQMIGRRRGATATFIEEAMKAGKVERKEFATKRSDGVRMICPMYRVIC